MGDGAHDTACSWLVIFLNIGKNILNRNENYLLFGANCDENCLPFSWFITKFLCDVKHLTNTIYSMSCKGETVQLPNYMKMVAFLGSELSKIATYFSSFADVSKHSKSFCESTYGSSASDMCKPWKYSKRVKVANAVEKFKRKLIPKLAESNNRSKVISLNASQIIRQDFICLVGELIDKALVDPLHLKNITCALAHRLLLNIAI